VARRRSVGGMLVIAGALAVLDCDNAAGQQAGGLADLSLEQLANIEVTSVSRRAERLSDAAASIYVITNEDIRRAGVTSVPEALRLAPSLQVARTSSSGYTISARGFNNSAGNKLLVLIDGRSVYTPLFSGVFWDVQDVLLEDIHRIEVISGPGGTLWGTNAVNGVINIITRSAKDTHGALIAAGVGNRESEAAVRHGGTFGNDGHYRIYGKYFDRDNTSTTRGARDDAWHKAQAGFRADWARAGDEITVQGNVYRGAEGQPAPGTISTGVNFALGDIAISGANLTARWARHLEGGSNLAVQVYYDRTERDVPPTFSQKLDIFDVQFQHALRPAGIHALVWGAEYRYGKDRVTNSTFFAFLPARVNQEWASVFAQDEMTLREDLRLTLGARLEHNDYTGYEFLPSARLAWKFSPDHLLWAAASRAVRSPSRLDRDVFIPGTPPFLLAGGPNVRSEVANVYEVGYRGQPAPGLSYSVTAFHSDYDRLRSQELASSGTFVFFANEMEGKTRGVEMWGTYQALRNWRLSGGLMLLDTDLRRKPGSRDPTGPSALGNDPNHQWLLRSSLDLTPKHEFDVMVRHVGALPNPTVPAYTAVDARLGWHVRRDLELSLTLQNLFDPGHPEFGVPATRSELQRAFFLKLLWRI
jgi:iron complex outermembrane recepter protein